VQRTCLIHLIASPLVNCSERLLVKNIPTAASGLTVTSEEVKS
jgi:hypothetical protein